MTTIFDAFKRRAQVNGNADSHLQVTHLPIQRKATVAAEATVSAEALAPVFLTDSRKSLARPAKYFVHKPCTLTKLAESLKKGIQALAAA
jgi:hypothetical protein